MDATAYRQFSIAQKRGELELFERMGCSGTGSLLDIGCGEGRITSQMAAALPDWTVTGLDISREMLSLAEQSYNQSNLKFSLGTLDQLPADQTFDAITIFSALHLIPNNDKLLAEVRRRLNPGGKLTLITHPLDSPAAQILRDVFLAPEWAHNIDRNVINARRTLAQYRDSLSELGFKTLHDETYQSERYADSKEKLVEIISMALPLFGTFNADESQRCAEAVATALGTTQFSLLTIAYIGQV